LLPAASSFEFCGESVQLIFDVFTIASFVLFACSLLPAAAGTCLLISVKKAFVRGPRQTDRIEHLSKQKENKDKEESEENRIQLS